MGGGGAYGWNYSGRLGEKAQMWRGFQKCEDTMGIESGPDAFDKLRFDMTFLAILRVAEILCSFRLVLEGKRDKEIPESSRLEFFFLIGIHSMQG